MLDGRLGNFYDKAHIPTSKSVPFSDVMDSNFCFKSKEELIKVF